jgi:hypothetical protein
MTSGIRGVVTPEYVRSAWFVRLFLLIAAAEGRQLPGGPGMLSGTPSAQGEFEPDIAGTIHPGG